MTVPEYLPENMLEPGETVLWSHIVEPPAKVEARGENKIAQRFFRIISLTAYGVCAIFVIMAFIKGRAEGAEISREGLKIGIIGGIIGLAVTAFSRSKWGRKLQRGSDRPIFQNGFVTNKRVILFNHYNHNRAIYRAADIKQAVIDFENGGYALKIVPASNDLPSVLVGGVDFKQAVAIISKHLL